MRPDAEGRAQASAALSAGWAALSTRMAPSKDGPFFCGAQFTVFECAVLPWFQRLYSVLQHYRGYTLPEGEGEGGDNKIAFDRLREWYAACLARPDFAATVVDRDRLIGNYSGYADNSATSAEGLKTRAAGGFGSSVAAASAPI